MVATWSNQVLNMKVKPHGIYPILYAFYDEGGILDRAAMRSQVNSCIQVGAHGIAVLGLITEVLWLSDSERMQVIEWAVEDIDNRVPLAATVAGESVEAQIQLARHAETVGADWLILQPPQTWQPNELELLRFFGSIMDATSLPVGIQNFPEVLGVGLNPSNIRTLQHQHANFTVMKGEGPVYSIRQYIDASEGNISIFNGRGGIELPDNLRAGCSGIIPAPDCADLQIAMYEAYIENNYSRLDQLYALSLPYVTFIMQSVDFALTYGKRLAARRMNIPGDHVPRKSLIQTDTFGLQRLEGHSEFMGSFGQWHEQDVDSGVE